MLELTPIQVEYHNHIYNIQYHSSRDDISTLLHSVGAGAGLAGPEDSLVVRQARLLGLLQLLAPPRGDGDYHHHHHHHHPPPPHHHHHHHHHKREADAEPGFGGGYHGYGGGYHGGRAVNEISRNIQRRHY